MAKGPKGEKRPADLNRRAFDIVRIASGEVEEKLPLTAADRGRKGGAARAKTLASNKRKEIARKGAAVRWQKEPT